MCAFSFAFVSHALLRASSNNSCSQKSLARQAIEREREGERGGRQGKKQKNSMQCNNNNNKRNCAHRFNFECDIATAPTGEKTRKQKHNKLDCHCELDIRCCCCCDRLSLPVWWSIKCVHETQSISVHCFRVHTDSSLVSVPVRAEAFSIQVMCVEVFCAIDVCAPIVPTNSITWKNSRARSSSRNVMVKMYM